jgi:hypothetical protein
MQRVARNSESVCADFVCRLAWRSPLLSSTTRQRLSLRGCSKMQPGRRMRFGARRMFSRKPRSTTSSTSRID